MNERIEIRTLTDGGQQPVEIAHAVAAFLDGAQHTLDLAQYDFNLGPETAAIVGDAIRRAAERGVKIRFIYNVDHAIPIPVPPPPEPDATLIASLPVDGRPIAGIPDLMHHKYVIRDGADRLDRLAELDRRLVVATGERGRGRPLGGDREGVPHRLRPAVVDARTSRRAGFVDPRWDDGVRAWFTPGHGEDLSSRIAKMIRRAKRRVRICSPVITTGPVLGTLAQVIADGRVDVAGCVDSTQVREVIRQWQAQRQRLLEAAAARAGDGAASSPARSRRRTARARCTTSCTRR